MRVLVKGAIDFSNVRYICRTDCIDDCINCVNLSCFNCVHCPANYCPNVSPI